MITLMNSSMKYFHFPFFSLLKPSKFRWSIGDRSSFFATFFFLWLLFVFFFGAARRHRFGSTPPRRSSSLTAWASARSSPSPATTSTTTTSTSRLAIFFTYSDGFPNWGQITPPPEGNMTPGTLDSPKNALKIFANIWCSGCKWIYDVNNVYKLAGNFLSYIHGFPNLGSNYPLEGNMTPDTLDSQKLLSKYLRKGGVRTARSFTMLTA